MIKTPTKEQTEYIIKLFKDNDEMIQKDVAESSSNFFIISIDSDFGLVKFKYRVLGCQCVNITYYLFDANTGLIHRQDTTPLSWSTLSYEGIEPTRSERSLYMTHVFNDELGTERVMNSQTVPILVNHDPSKSTGICKVKCDEFEIDLKQQVIEFDSIEECESDPTITFSQFLEKKKAEYEKLGTKYVEDNVITGENCEDGSTVTKIITVDDRTKELEQCRDEVLAVLERYGAHFGAIYGEMGCTLSICDPNYNESVLFEEL